VPKLNSTMVLLFFIVCLPFHAWGNDTDDLANAIMGEDYPRVRIMITRNPALVNLKGQEGWYPLHYTVAMNRKRIALLLIQNGANLDLRDDEGWSPLHLAAYQGQKDLAFLLVSRGADVNGRDVNQWTPLHHAANSYSDGDFNTIARLLIEHGADVNARTSDGKTPLALALTHGREDLVLLLRKKGGRN
jgi:ankyrin repeat protein